MAVWIGGVRVCRCCVGHGEATWGRLAAGFGADGGGVIARLALGLVFSFGAFGHGISLSGRATHGDDLVLTDRAAGGWLTPLVAWGTARRPGHGRCGVVDLSGGVQSLVGIHCRPWSGGAGRVVFGFDQADGDQVARIGDWFLSNDRSDAGGALGTALGGRRGELGDACWGRLVGLAGAGMGLHRRCLHGLFGCLDTGFGFHGERDLQLGARLWHPVSATFLWRG